MSNQNSPATDTDFLSERIKQNEKNQSLNLNEWAFSLIDKSDKQLNILELCCGTGRQTVCLSSHFPNSQLTCLDVSNEAVEAVKNASFFEPSRMQAITSDMDSFFAKRKEQYDIIFVSYGLYYATNIDIVLQAIVNALNQGGKFIVLGPYGKNNLELFDLCRASRVEIPEFVTHSCTDFMCTKVIAQTLSYFSKFNIDTAINPVKWKNKEEVISYWKSSTFYAEAQKKAFTHNLHTHFESEQAFINRKHIMLFQAQNKK